MAISTPKIVCDHFNANQTLFVFVTNGNPDKNTRQAIVKSDTAHNGMPAGTPHIINYERFIMITPDSPAVQRFREGRDPYEILASDLLDLGDRKIDYKSGDRIVHVASHGRILALQMKPTSTYSFPEGQPVIRR